MTISTLQGASILVTGAAGFIGAAVAERLLAMGHSVVGVDDLNAYYDVRLKEARLARLLSHPGFRFERLTLADRAATADLFARHQPTHVVHLAAQAGVRYSIEHPETYIDSNLVGFCNVLEGCRHGGIAHLVYASSSSVYGANTDLPFRVEQTVDHPISLYAATKKANELMAHAYSHLYRLPVSGLRLFTVYGPWGRPDMAVFLFTDAIWHGRPIKVFNNGDMQRDFTFIDDVVDAVVALLPTPATPDPAWTGADPDPATSNAPYRIYNVGNHSPEPLMALIGHIEAALGRKAELDFQPMQAGDVPATFADVTSLAQAVDFAPRTPLKEGVARFATWYREVWLAEIAKG